MKETRPVETDHDKTLPQRVEIVEIDVPFFTLVGFFLKAIAAFLVASIPFGILAAIFIPACDPSNWSR